MKHRRSFKKSKKIKRISNKTNKNNHKYHYYGGSSFFEIAELSKKHHIRDKKKKSKKSIHKPIIFLDVDGVLHRSSKPGSGIARYAQEFELVDNIRELAINENAKIIVSSNWRKHLDLMEQLIHQLNPNHTNTIEIETLKPDYSDPFFASLPDLPGDRGLLIFNYIKQNNINNYIILDDMEESDMFGNNKQVISKLKPHFYKTKYNIGFTYDDIIPAKNMLYNS